jgi:hypothetical protein
MRAAHLIPGVGLADPRHVLPPEQGALILVLGGTAVLVVSLTVALARGGSRLQRRSHPTPSVGPRPEPDDEPPPGTASHGSRLADHELFLKAAARAGVGTPQVVTDNPGPSALMLVDCLSCHAGGEQPACSWREESLAEALEHFDPDGRVRHVLCRPDEGRACIFEIQTGDARS